eukprot:360394-Chlamydomonas_euryale.AAC.3
MATSIDNIVKPMCDLLLDALGKGKLKGPDKEALCTYEALSPRFFLRDAVASTMLMPASAARRAGQRVGGGGGSGGGGGVSIVAGGGAGAPVERVLRALHVLRRALRDMHDRGDLPGGKALQCEKTVWRVSVGCVICVSAGVCVWGGSGS